MHFLHINSKKDVGKVDQMIKQGKHVFLLVYMVGCGPCNATRPEWEQIESALKDQYAHKDNVVVIDIDKDYVSNIKHIGTIDGFPTIKYIGNRGKIVESYENSSIQQKDRSVSSFINWIETKINIMQSAIHKSSAKQVYKRLSHQQKIYNRRKSRKHKRHYKKHTRKHR